LRSVFRLRGMRTIQLTIAMTMLAVPASAFALSDTTSADAHHDRRPASLPVQIAPRHVRLGHPVSITGRAGAAQAGHEVQLQSDAAGRGSWHAVADTRIGRRGRFHFRAHLRRTGMLRAVEVAGDVDRRPHAARRGTRAHAVTGPLMAISAPAMVRVKAAVQIAERQRAVLEGAQVDLSGALAPARAGRPVAVQARTDHRWRTVAESHTGHRGRFAVRFRPRHPGDQPLRVVFRGDRFNDRATHAAGMLEQFVPTVASWYEDYGTTACGYHAGYGVANRTLPCGTRVRLRYGGHSVTATVDDRGPYVYGRDFDLNQTTAAALHFGGVGTVEADIR
jgi:rare lipoprotein A